MHDVLSCEDFFYWWWVVAVLAVVQLQLWGCLEVPTTALTVPCLYATP